MDAMTTEGRLGMALTIDVCIGCQGFWYDRYESLKLSPAATLKLIGLVGEQPQPKAPLPESLHCPRCSQKLVLTHDLQKNTRFSYWRCTREHGRFIRFFDFLKEKNFIRALSAKQIEELKQNIQAANCSNCGAPIDLAKSSSCLHCGSPLSMLDTKLGK
jgi:hypothetical protein